MKILYFDPEGNDAERIPRLLFETWPSIVAAFASREEDFLAQLKRTDDWDLALVGTSSEAGSPLSVLSALREIAPGLPCIVLAEGSVADELGTEAIEAGASDVVDRTNAKRLVIAVRRAIRDREERRQREEAEAGWRRFAGILESTPDFVGMAALTGEVFFINRAGLAMLGRPEGQDPGLLSLRDCHPPEAYARLTTEIIPTARRVGSWVGENELLGPKGTRIPVSQAVIAHHAADGSIEYLSTIMRDLTAVKEAQRHVREQAELLDEARDAIIVRDLDDCVTYWNRGAEKIFGWSRAEAIGSRVVSLLGAGLAEDDHALNSLAINDEWRGELSVRDRSGRNLTMDARITTIRDETGQARSRLSILSDITAKKQVEEQFLRAQRLESLGMLAAGIAHDLNNVLAPILMAAPLLRNHARRVEDRRLIDGLELSAKRGAALVRQILGFAHGIGGEPQVVQIKSIIRDLTAFVTQTFPKSIRFESIQADKLWSIRADPTQLHQVLLNLCLNARDALADGGRIRLTCENRILGEGDVADGASPGAYVMLSVEDTGVGISPEVLAHIWEPFFTTKEKGKGTGLGLSTVRGIVQGHHGFVKVESGNVRGTVFRVFLPALGADAEHAALELPQLPGRGRGELILVVDDEITVRDITMAILAHHGYRVIGAGDGAEAATLLAPRSSEVRMVITDLQMPNLDGAGLAGVVHRLNPAIKVIAVSGMGSNRSIKAARQYASAFLLKPFNAEELIGTVERLLDAREVAARN